MTSAVQREKEYEILRRKQIERKQKMVAAISILSFGGSMIFGLFQLFTNLGQKPVISDGSGTVVQESPLEAEARGYELVLQREPNNQVALEGLVNARLKMNQGDAAMISLDKLIQLHPDRQDYKDLLGEINKRTKQK